MKGLTKTRQPYSGIVLNNAQDVKIFGNKVRARYSDDYSFTLENDDGNDYKVKGGGNNKSCRGKVDDNLSPYVNKGGDPSQDDCDEWFAEAMEGSSATAM